MHCVYHAARMSTRLRALATEIFRYGLASGLSLLVDVALLAVLVEVAGLHYLVSAALSYSAGLIVNYLISVLYVFRYRRIQDRRVEFVSFAGIGLLGLGINQALMWLLTGILGVYYPMSRVISAGIGYTWKYLARKTLLFRRRPET